MRRSTLIASLLVLGAALWLSSRAVEAQPAYAAVVVLAVLVWSMGVAARPSRN
jgi:cytochrome c oxidase assembly factor CtaG